MRPLYGLLLVVFSLFNTERTTAQRRFVSGPFWQPTLQTELALKGDDYLLVGLKGQISPYTIVADPSNRVGVNIGYERFWSETWSGGATLLADFYSSYRNGGDVSRLYAAITPELFVRHWNTIGGFNFRQRLGAEYFSPGSEISEGRALTRLRLDLDRVFPLGGQTAIRPRLAYEAAAYLRLQRDEDEPKERVIDFGTLRAEVGVRVSHFDFTPWVASQTGYKNFLPQYDINGNQTSDGRTNFISPIVGLDVRLTLFRGGASFERRQLPTQH